MIESSITYNPAYIRTLSEAKGAPAEPSWLYQLDLTQEEIFLTLATGKPWGNLLTTTPEMLDAMNHRLITSFSGGQMMDRNEQGLIVPNKDRIWFDRKFNELGIKFNDPNFTPNIDFKKARIANRIGTISELDIYEFDEDTAAMITLVETLLDQGLSRRNHYYDSYRIAYLVGCKSPKDSGFNPPSTLKNAPEIAVAAESIANLLREEVLYFIKAAQFSKNSLSDPYGNVIITKSGLELNKAYKSYPEADIFTIHPDKIELLKLIQGFSMAMDGKPVIFNFPIKTVWHEGNPIMTYDTHPADCTEDQRLAIIADYCSQATKARQLVLAKLIDDPTSAITTSKEETFDKALEFFQLLSEKHNRR